MAAERTAGDGRARYWLAAGLTLGVLGLAVAGGLLAPSVSAGPLIGVESMSARISGVLLSLGTKTPLGYGFVAGMVAAVNPCGFVLLPAYLGLYLGDDQHASKRYRPVRRALTVSVTVTASFMLSGWRASWPGWPPPRSPPPCPGSALPSARA